MRGSPAAASGGGGDGRASSHHSGARLPGHSVSRACSRVVPHRGNPTTINGATIRSSPMAGNRFRSAIMRSRHDRTFTIWPYAATRSGAGWVEALSTDTNRSSDARKPSSPKSDSAVSSPACRSNASASTWPAKVTLGLLDIPAPPQHQGPAGEVLHVVADQRSNGSADVRFTVAESAERRRLDVRREGLGVPVSPFLRRWGHRAGYD